MSTATQAIGQSPFNPISRFMAVATGDERVTLAAPNPPVIQIKANVK